MSPARRSVPAVLRVLGGLPLPLPLLLLLCAPAVRGDCGLPPEMPNAIPVLEGETSFPEGKAITYKCNESFAKIPGMPDSVICLSNNQWSQLETFCDRSCDIPIRLNFAVLKKDYSMRNYFPAGSTVEYECRPGYRRDPSLSPKLTCLENLTWSEPTEFCQRKPCPNPGELRNGRVNVITNFLFGSHITFSCDTGYKLVGATSSYCSLKGATVEWSDPLPECIEILCPEPPKIDNGYLQEEHDVYVYSQSVTYACEKGFTMVGKSSIYCTIKDDQGEWSDPPPQCTGKSSPSKSPPIVQQPTTVNVPATQRTPGPKATTSFHTTSTTERKGTPYSGVLGMSTKQGENLESHS